MTSALRRDRGFSVQVLVVSRIVGLGLRTHGTLDNGWICNIHLLRTYQVNSRSDTGSMIFANKFLNNRSNIDELRISLKHFISLGY